MGKDLGKHPDKSKRLIHARKSEIAPQNHPHLI
jgi:hypothetical protein